MTRAESQPRPPLLYAPDVSRRRPGEVTALEREEARHVRALRLTEGDAVRLTDGAGVIWRGRLQTADGRTAACVLEDRLVSPPRLPVDLAFAIGNKAHVLWLVEKAAEMGVERLIPLEAARSRSVADAGRSPAFWAKAERRAISAMKQSGGAWLPEVGAPKTPEEYLESPDAAIGPGGGPSVRLEGDGPPLNRVLGSWGGTGRARLVVGPEGGWSVEESEALEEKGFVAGSLGPLVLRFETAAIAGLAVVAQHLLSLDAGESAPPAG